MSGLIFGKEKTITSHDLSDHHPVIANIKIIKKDKEVVANVNKTKPKKSRNKRRLDSYVPVYGDRRPI